MWNKIFSSLFCSKSVNVILVYLKEKVFSPTNLSCDERLSSDVSENDTQIHHLVRVVGAGEKLLFPVYRLLSNTGIPRIADIGK